MFPALQKLRGKEDVLSELDEMSKEARVLSATGEKFSTVQLFTKTELRKPLMIAIVVQIAQQWSGLNAVSQIQTPTP